MILYTALLAPCHHKRHWKNYNYCPRVGEIVFCPSCGDDRSVMAVVGPWNGVCRDCGFRVVRASGESALANAEQHARRFPHHTVEVWEIRGGSSRKAGLRVVTAETVRESPPTLFG